jgi:hypothetical protein
MTGDPGRSWGRSGLDCNRSSREGDAGDERLRSRFCEILRRDNELSGISGILLLLTELFMLLEQFVEYPMIRRWAQQLVKRLRRSVVSWTDDRLLRRNYRQLLREQLLTRLFLTVPRSFCRWQ